MAETEDKTVRATQRCPSPPWTRPLALVRDPCVRVLPAQI